MKLACLQMNSTRDIAHNIARLETLVKDAVVQDAEFVATPENTFVMGEPAEGETRIFYTMANHPGIPASARIAKDYKIWLLIGSIAVLETGADSQKTYNRSLLFNPEGQIVAHYDKIHLFDVALPGGETYTESARILPGERAVTAQTPWGRLGMTICYDVRFPHLYRTLAKAGASILSVPAAFTVPTGEAHWHVLLRARAIETGCFVIAPAQTGTHPGNRKTYGHALIVDPWGKILTDAGEGEGIAIAELDLEEVGKTRGKLPSLVHDREFSLKD